MRGGLGTVGVRVPAHAVARALAVEPVAAPSANTSGRPSPTTAADVLADLGGRIDLVLDGGPCRLGVESTVVDARGRVPVVLRDGAVTREQLAAALGLDALPAAPDRVELGGSPGTRHPHYRPDCAVVLAAAGSGPAEAARQAAAGARVGLVAPVTPPEGVVGIGQPVDSAQLARELYRWLRAAEAAGIEVLVVEGVAEEGIGRAVMDRLRRAAGPAG